MASFSHGNSDDNEIFPPPTQRLNELYTLAFDCAKESNELKQKNKYYQACELLKESVQIFLEISEIEKDTRKIELLKSKTVEFVQDITDLTLLANEQKRNKKYEI